jgi:hypothetical protein
VNAQSQFPHVRALGAWHRSDTELDAQEFLEPEILARKVVLRENFGIDFRAMGFARENVCSSFRRVRDSLAKWEKMANLWTHDDRNRVLEWIPFCSPAVEWEDRVLPQAPCSQHIAGSVFLLQGWMGPLFQTLPFLFLYC